MRPRTKLSLSLTLATAITTIAPIARACTPHTPALIRTGEPLDRGLVALRLSDGSVFLSWRYLLRDPEDVSFEVWRQVEGQEPVRITPKPLGDRTWYRDTAAPHDRACAWFVRPVVDGRSGPPSKRVSLDPTSPPRPYLSIKLQGEYRFQKVGIADLDGDRRYDFVIKQPNANIDPYIRYWKPSPDTYKLEAYSYGGKLLWRFDLGWAIERGIWYSPYVVYDLDGDGRAEVAVKTGEGDPRGPDGRVETGPEYLTILDGATGKIRAQTDWIPRSPFYAIHGDRAYNYASRNQLGIAYLDGVHPHLIVERGTYGLIIVEAYRFRNEKLERIWRWSNQNLDRSYWGQGAHWMHAADVDADGRQEVVIGSVVIDDNGRELWTTGLGHPDHCYVGDIDPRRPGLEIYYGMETRQKRNGMCLVDAATGRILWGYHGPTRHVHSRGMCSDIDPRHPGWECYSADTNAQKQYAWSRLWSSDGRVISTENLGGFGPLTVFWDGDDQRELILDGKICDYTPDGPGKPIAEVHGQVVAVADILGDWREEIITTRPGELRIYVSTHPTSKRYRCLMQDPIYRTDVAHASMGYYQVPMLRAGLR